MKPRKIEIINNTLALVWEDGHESYFDLEFLRRHCPCALCQGEANVLVTAKPAAPQYTAASFTANGWHFVGGYAIQPRWVDGHASGIYSFQYLRHLCPCDACAARRQPSPSQPEP